VAAHPALAAEGADRHSGDAGLARQAFAEVHFVAVGIEGRGVA